MSKLTAWDHAQALNLNEDILHEGAMALLAEGITRPQEEDAVRRLEEAATAVYESKPPKAPAPIADILKEAGKL